jgi:hypothetical protein
MRLRTGSTAVGFRARLCHVLQAGVRSAVVTKSHRLPPTQFASMSPRPISDLPELRRVRFTSGQILGVDDFRAEQAYHRERQRLHNRMLHGWGVVAGLDVRSRGGEVIVSPGLALDAAGDEVILTTEHILTLPPPLGADRSRYLIVRYAETLTDPIEALALTEPQTEFTRVLQGATIGAQVTLPRAPDLGIAIARVLWRTSQWRADPRFKRRRVQK